MSSPVNLNFRVSPRVLGPLGLEQLQDPALAVLELIKNSWDANATRVSVDIVTRGANPSVAVIDNGDGMSLNDFQARWLVIGSSHKRGAQAAQGARPLIGEKGLGRLASYALGSDLTIESAKDGKRGFVAKLNWDELLKAQSVEAYKIKATEANVQKGAKVVIGNLKLKWSEEYTKFLTTHTQFLTSVPGQKFHVQLKVDGKSLRIADPLEAISSIAEAEMEVAIGRDGVPKVVACTVDNEDYSATIFRDFPPKQADGRLAGARVSLRFYRRDQATKKLTGVLKSNSIGEVLERYQGVRIYKNGINVPPYGLNGDDWAALEKQRTATGGPTMVPGNSQLVGELRVPASAAHLVVTAGRSGFADQAAVKVLARYVQWAVKELGTARRAKALGIKPGSGPVPGRVDFERGHASEGATSSLAAIREVADQQAVKSDPALRNRLIDAKRKVEQELKRNEETLRLYAQLASTGIAATSFAHEMRADFDVVTEAVDEIAQYEGVDSDLLQMLSTSWQRITSFVALFKVVPVKVRRSRRTLSSSAIMAALQSVAELAPSDKIQVKISPFERRLSIVPAELDSILLNLVTNAVKAVGESSSSSRGKIKVSMDTRGEDLTIRVADNGCGVSSRVASIMFEPLEGKFAEGTGMGLPIVKFIAERYGGSAFLGKPSAGYATEICVGLKGVVK